MITWLTGNSGAGKTTLAKNYQQKHPNAIILDGDEMRSSISEGLSFSPDDRHMNNIRIAKLAKVLERQGFDVIISVIAPLAATRMMIDEVISCNWVYLKRTLPVRENYIYEEPKGYFTLDVDNLTVEKECTLLMNHLIYD